MYLFLGLKKSHSFTQAIYFRWIIHARNGQQRYGERDWVEKNFWQMPCSLDLLKTMASTQIFHRLSFHCLFKSLPSTFVLLPNCAENFIECIISATDASVKTKHCINLKWWHISIVVHKICCNEEKVIK